MIPPFVFDPDNAPGFASALANGELFVCFDFGTVAECETALKELLDEQGWKAKGWITSNDGDRVRFEYDGGAT